ncbi:unnamed protein product [Prorocentrum cordatum]|uniref:Uncharacterized protein n=1 Tax=Prorocentrum cordatum TaxID=2364126 RepID=A0ABN9Y0B2_9DINO|nr:unnamed protein product [Polarella glacialis]
MAEAPVRAAGARGRRGEGCAVRLLRPEDLHGRPALAMEVLRELGRHGRKSRAFHGDLDRHRWLESPHRSEQRQVDEGALRWERERVRQEFALQCQQARDDRDLNVYSGRKRLDDLCWDQVLLHHHEHSATAVRCAQACEAARCAVADAGERAWSARERSLRCLVRALLALAAYLALGPWRASGLSRAGSFAGTKQTVHALHAVCVLATALFFIGSFYDSVFATRAARISSSDLQRGSADHLRAADEARQAIWVLDESFAQLQQRLRADIRELQKSTALRYDAAVFRIRGQHEGAMRWLAHLDGSLTGGPRVFALTPSRPPRAGRTLGQIREAFEAQELGARALRERLQEQPPRLRARAAAARLALPGAAGRRAPPRHRRAGRRGGRARRARQAVAAGAGALSRGGAAGAASAALPRVAGLPWRLCARGRVPRRRLRGGAAAAAHGALPARSVLRAVRLPGAAGPAAGGPAGGAPAVLCSMAGGRPVGAALPGVPRAVARRPRGDRSSGGGRGGGVGGARSRRCACMGGGAGVQG